MQEFFSISLLIILAAISPGPDFAMVVKNSLRYSRKIGLFTSLGVSLSLLIHSIYCIFGLAVLVTKSLLVFSMIKYLGALYLSYIGIKSLLSKKEVFQASTVQMKTPCSARSAFFQGLFCNLLNPKAILFLIAFFTLIVKPGHSFWIELGYGMDIALIHLIWFSSISLLITHRVFRQKLDQLQYYIVKAMGVLLIGFGFRVALLAQPI